MKGKKQLVKYLCSDLISSACAWFIFNIVRFYDLAQYTGFVSLADFFSFYKIIQGQVLVPLFWIIIFYYSGYYNKPLEKSRLSEFFVTLISVLLGTVLIFFTILINDLPPSFHIYYEQFFYLFIFTFILVYTFRLIITQRATRKIHSREWAIRALILGTGKKAHSVAQMLEKPYNSMGYLVEGYIDTGQDTSSEIPDSAILGEIDDLERIIKNRKIETLIIAPDTNEDKQLIDLLYSLYCYKLPIKLPVSSVRVFGGFKLNTVAGIPLVDVTDNNFPEGEKNIKDTLDRLVALIIILLFSPLYLYLWFRVRLDSPGPVFLKQERIGYLGKPFFIYKFRTMVENAEENGPCLSSESDGRVTRFGKLMRKYRLDELPQFWNVLKGDMSLVGPRPERKYYIDRIVREAPYYYLLHNVRPGITSWGMVKYGYASSVDQMIERMQYDILYYENMSLLLDLKILIYTVKTVLTGKGI